MGSSLDLPLYITCRCSLATDTKSHHGLNAALNHTSEGGSELHHIISADDSLFFFLGTVKNVRALKSIIVDYCRASRKRINTKKSSQFFIVMRWGPDFDYCGGAKHFNLEQP